MFDWDDQEKIEGMLNRWSRLKVMFGYSGLFFYIIFLFFVLFLFASPAIFFHNINANVFLLFKVFFIAVSILGITKGLFDIILGNALKTRKIWAIKTAFLLYLLNYFPAFIALGGVFIIWAIFQKESQSLLVFAILLGSMLLLIPAMLKNYQGVNRVVARYQKNDSGS